jgi:hypothetical protein
MKLYRDAHPLRLEVDRLAAPGRIGMRDPRGLSFARAPHLLVGPDAGFPEFQPLDEWKCDVALVDARALSSEVRAAAGIQLPEEAIAVGEAYDRDLAEAGARCPPMLDGEEVSALRLAERARLHAIEDSARRVLVDSGASYWVAGYTRHSDTLWVHRVGGAEPFSRWADRWETEYAGDPPLTIARARFRAILSTRWPDRVLRALSGGAVSEPALLFARRRLARWPVGCVVEDDLAHAAIEAEARIAAGDEVVDVPLHGPVRRVRLPAFTLRASEMNPLDAVAGKPCRTRAIEVPREDVYVPLAQAR